MASQRNGSRINLCFHGIGTPARELEPGEETYWISQDTFERVLDAVADDPRVRLSFDDGNSSDVEIGLPGLLARGLTATFFVLAGRLDRPGSVSTADVRRLHELGMPVGSHGMDHVPWRGLSDADLQRELVDARTVIAEAVGAPVTEAAAPLGRYDRRVLGALRRHGYSAVHTSDRRWARPDAWVQPRFSLHRGDTVETVRRSALTPAPLVERAKLEAIGVVKRLR